MIKQKLINLLINQLLNVFFDLWHNLCNRYDDLTIIKLGEQHENIIDHYINYRFIIF